MKTLAAALLLCLLVGAFGFADTSTTYMYVTGYNVPGISVSAGTMNFGTFHIGEGDLFTTANITINAPNTWAYHIALDAGEHFSGSYRHIASESNNAYQVPYWLYKSDFSAWGDSDYNDTFPPGPASRERAPVPTSSTP